MATTFNIRLSTYVLNMDSYTVFRFRDIYGTPGAQGRSLSSAIVSSSQGTDGVHQAEGANNTIMATTSSPAPAVIEAALGSGGGQQDDSEMSKVREIPLVSTSGLPNGRRIVGLLYEYSKVDEVTILCMCHGSFLTPAEFVEHAGGGQVANPLGSIFVMPPPWL
ncbi:ninja-family protein MODD-like [Triticum dicoccoides]|uniref:ninja-family protein MODD-like n=1 Tax=Triticum dicoccoides TaxID=85692 RepID=UPI0018904CA2|nr:ninja-family protein MODD-like [Triticum dicoccoides]